MAMIPMEYEGGVLGSRVTLSSSDLPYTTPSDGYVWAAMDSTNCVIYVDYPTAGHGVLNIGEAKGRFAVYVKKGWKISTNGQMPSVLAFIPITDN